MNSVCLFRLVAELPARAKLQIPGGGEQGKDPEADSDFQRLQKLDQENASGKRLLCALDGGKRRIAKRSA